MSVVFRFPCYQTTDHKLRPGSDSHAAALHCSCGQRLRWVKHHQLGIFERQYGQQRPERDQQLEMMGGEL